MLNGILSMLGCSPNEDIKEAETYRSLALELFNTRNFSGGIVYFERYLYILENSLKGYSIHIIKAYEELGNICLAHGRYQNAEKKFERALNILLKTWGIKHVLAADLYNCIGYACYGQGQYKKAETMYQQALEVQKGLYIKDNAKLAQIHCNIGIMLNTLGETKKAREYFESSLKNLKSTKEAAQNQAKIYNNIGVSYTKEGDCFNANLNLIIAIDLNKKSSNPENPAIAVNFTNLAEISFQKGNKEQAIHYLETAMSIEKSYFGECHPKIGFEYNNIGLVYYELQKNSLSVKNLNKSVHIKLKLASECNLELAETLIWLSKNFLIKYNYHAALNFLKAAISIRIREIDTLSTDQILVRIKNRSENVEKLEMMNSISEFDNLKV